MWICFQNFFRLSPGFCFADGLASLALLRQGMKDKTSDAVFDWNVTGASICYLGVEVKCLFSFFFYPWTILLYPKLRQECLGIQWETHCSNQPQPFKFCFLGHNKKKDDWCLWEEFLDRLLSKIADSNCFLLSQNSHWKKDRNRNKTDPKQKRKNVKPKSHPSSDIMQKIIGLRFNISISYHMMHKGFTIMYTMNLDEK